MSVGWNIRIVCATTKKNEEEFKADTLLGQSLDIFPPELMPQVSTLLGNTGPSRVGLSQFYNSFLRPQYRGEIAVFIHDDVVVQDWCLVPRLREAMQHFDVVGVAGNCNPDYSQPSWALGWDRAKHPDAPATNTILSGAVAHLSADRTGIGISHFGPAPKRCVLVDGLFIAVNVDKALEKKVRFDDQFEFHFYDMDFCRSADRGGLRIGTWPIALAHGSIGGFQTPAWESAKQAYFRKWAAPK